MALEVVQSWDGGPFVVNKHALAGEQYICILIAALALVFDTNSPLASFFNPSRFSHPVVQPYVPVKVPFLRCAENVVLDLGTTGVEARPPRVGIKRECLTMSAISDE